MEQIALNYTLDQNAFPPTKAHDEDAGFDIKTPVDFTLSPGYYATIETGVHIAIPKGYCGLLVSKSGLNVKSGIHSTGLIDSGYTGQIVVKLEMDGNHPTKTFKRGDKVSQLVILPIPSCELHEVESLENTDRGDNGFGSSGR